MLTYILTTVFLFLLGYTTIFRVKDVHIGVPSSIFTGRLKRKTDEDGCSVRIRRPYKEGLHIKRPWWTIKQESREVRTKPIEKRPFPVGEGGTVLISGVIQHRISNKAAYRYEEVDQAAIEEGLDSELEQIIRGTLEEKDVEGAIKKTRDISRALTERLMGFDIRTSEEIESSPDSPPKERKLFGDKDGDRISHSEHSYGIEILKAKIDTIDPDESIKAARDDKQKEKYESESQTTEWNHLLDRAAQLKESRPGMSDEKIWDAVQVWQKQSTKHVDKIEIEGIESFAKLLTSFIASRGGSK